MLDAIYGESDLHFAIRVWLSIERAALSEQRGCQE